MKDEKKIIDGLKHWIQNEENGVCFIPLNLCKKTIELLKEQQKEIEKLKIDRNKYFNAYLHEGRY